MADKFRVRPPKYAPGYVKADLTVIAYDGRSAPRYSAKERHWYRVQCQCGVIEILEGVRALQTMATEKGA